MEFLSLSSIGTQARFYDLKQAFAWQACAKLKTYRDRAYSVAALNYCGISYHWTSCYQRQLLYLKLSLRHICLRILLI